MFETMSMICVHYDRIAEPAIGAAIVTAATQTRTSNGCPHTSGFEGLRSENNTFAMAPQPSMNNQTAGDHDRFNSAWYRSRQDIVHPALPQNAHSVTPKQHQHQQKNRFCAAVGGATSMSLQHQLDDYDTPDVPFMMPTALTEAAAVSSSSSSSVASTAYRSGGGVAKPDQFAEITQMALLGCDMAERLAHTHRNRPCFKKIDSLCARMKQDLVRQDTVLANINSQGMAWAVKDFIFVFTRIINAWIIIKGYVYNTPEGLAKVKCALSPDFDESFARWQAATKDFVENLIHSFVNLDQKVQSQRNAFQKFEPTTATGNCGGGVSNTGKTRPANCGGSMGVCYIIDSA